jgi:23S rRNA pseudouridine1911/1915/1917 synthase
MLHPPPHWFYMKSFDSEEPEILYSDNHLLVAVKPSGWLTQPDDSGRPDLETAAKEWVKKEYRKPGAVFLHCIHRLDRPVAGLLLFARTSKALSRLNEASRAHQICRRYRAEVEGIVSKKEGILEHFLLHGEHKALVVKADTAQAKKAVLRYRVLGWEEHASVVEIELETGRYHQIRAQWSANGHPVVGDEKYGARARGKDEICLACVHLSFAHPVTKEKLQFDWRAGFEKKNF